MRINDNLRLSCKMCEMCEVHKASHLHVRSCCRSNELCEDEVPNAHLSGSRSSTPCTPVSMNTATRPLVEHVVIKSPKKASHLMSIVKKKTV